VRLWNGVNLDVNTVSLVVLRFLCVRRRYSLRAEELRSIYLEDIHYFVQQGSSLLEKLHTARSAFQNSEQVRLGATKVLRLPFVSWHRLV